MEFHHRSIINRKFPAMARAPLPPRKAHIAFDIFAANTTHSCCCCCISLARCFGAITPVNGVTRPPPPPRRREEGGQARNEKCEGTKVTRG